MTGKEFDTYKVGTVANSTSTMHTIQNKPITKELFETDDYHPELDMIDDINLGTRVDCFINDLEQLRQIYLMTKDEDVKKWYWKELIRWLPCGWLQTRTVTMSYENLLAMCGKGQRRFHKLTEWSGTERISFIGWARTLPYAQELIFIDELDAPDPWDAIKKVCKEKKISEAELMMLLEAIGDEEESA